MLVDTAMIHGCLVIFLVVVAVVQTSRASSFFSPASGRPRRLPERCRPGFRSTDDGGWSGSGGRGGTRGSTPPAAAKATDRRGMIPRGPPRNAGGRVTPTRLFGISEWRDLFFSYPGAGDDRRLGREQGPPPKEVCILPFPHTDVLLQGETKQLRLYEERFIELFDDCMENHCGVVAMGLLTASGVIQTVPLCEIEAYNRMTGTGFGIFVTIRVVGRARLIDITRQEPYLKAVCAELADTLPPNLELPNLVASDIENFMLLLSSMEHRLQQAQEERRKSDTNYNSTSADFIQDAEMQRRINVAKLEGRIFQNVESDEEESDEEEVEMDRRARFRNAFQVAMATDTQGYCIHDGSGGGGRADRSPQELTAVSWAAFCSDLLPDEEAEYRIQALDADHLLDRLKLATQMLREKKAKLRVQMNRAGLKFRGEDLDEDRPAASSSD